MKNKQGNKIRIKDIASQAGVSPGTVDRVLHNRGEVAEATRKHILDIVKKLGYEPNLVAKSLAMKKVCRIAAMIPDAKTDNPYWEKPLFGLQASANEVKDFNTSVSIYTFNLLSEQSFRETYSKLIKENPDGLIFAPVFPDASSEIINECEARGIPYIFINIKMEDCGNLAFFGQNAFQSGFLAGSLMHYSLPENSEILVVVPRRSEGLGFYPQGREEGFQSFFQSEHNIKKLKYHTVGVDMYQTNTLRGEMDRAFEECPEAVGIFVINSRAYKLGRYLQEKNKEDLLFIGYDLVNENLEYLERGVVNFLIGQKPEEQGYKSVQAMFNHLVAGKNVEKMNYSPIDIIMKENIDYYKNNMF